MLVCTALLFGCTARRTELPTPPSSGPTPALQVPAGAQEYVIDAERSLVTLRVYRAGPLARLGHNHVITSTTETGHVWIGADPAASGFEVRVPVATLVVDDSAARSAAGPDFASDVPEEAREGTRNNLLRAEVLDAGRYPELIARAVALGGTWQQPTVAAQLTLKGSMRTVDVPLRLTREADSITASGEFRILQSDFGMTPFSVAGGAIQVADAVDVSFAIRAVRR